MFDEPQQRSSGFPCDVVRRLVMVLVGHTTAPLRLARWSQPELLIRPYPRDGLLIANQPTLSCHGLCRGGGCPVRDCYSAGVSRIAARWFCSTASVNSSSVGIR